MKMTEQWPPKGYKVHE